MAAAAGGLRADGWAQLQGLRSRPDLNGTRARVLRFAEERGRWQVLAVASGEVLCVKPENAAAAEAAPGDPDNAGCAALLARCAAAAHAAAQPAAAAAGGLITEEQADAAVAQLRSPAGHWVGDGLIDAADCAQLQEEMSQLLQSGALVRDGNAAEVRTDVCLHFAPVASPDGAPQLRAAAERLCGAATRLSAAWGEELRAAPELQLALYDAAGAFYKPHRDAPPAPNPADCRGDLDRFFVSHLTAPRRLSLVLYLNSAAWDEAEQGGALRLHVGADPSSGSSCAAPVDLAPRGGRLVVFDSRTTLHEVRPTRARRAALTLWLLEPGA